MTFKRIIRTLLIFAVLLAVIALFLPDSFKVEKSMKIAANDSILYTQVADFENWKNWEPWAPLDPEAKYTNTGEGLSAMREWDGEINGKGSIELIELEAYKKVGTTLTFYDPNPMASYCYWTFDQSGDSTEVGIGCSGDLGFPFGRIFGLFVDFEEAMGPDFDKALNNLKDYAEPVQEMMTKNDTL